MSTYSQGIAVVCDECSTRLPTIRTTSAGARGDAERKGWRVAHQGDGYHPIKRSNDPRRSDLCPACRPKRGDAGTLMEVGANE